MPLCIFAKIGYLDIVIRAATCVLDMNYYLMSANTDQTHKREKCLDV